MKVKDCAVQIRGVSYKPTDLHSKLNDNSVTLFRANNIKDGEIIFDDVLYVDKKCVSDEQYLKKGDILICASSGSKALVGKAAQIDFNGEYTFGAFCKAVRPNKNDDAILGVFFQSHAYRRMISALSQGVNINNIRNEHIDNLELPFFTVEVKQKFINQIQIVTKSIACCQHLLQKLDTLVKSRFIEMFGDPVLNPMGWETARLAELGELNRGVSKHRPRNAPELLNGPYPLVQTGDVANADTYIKEYSSTYSEIGLKQSRMWSKGTLCITIAANIAKTGILMFDACFPDSVVGFIAGEKTNQLYIHHWFSFFQKILEEQAPQSAQKNINLQILSNLSVMLPPITLQNQFADFVAQTDKLKLTIRRLLEKQELLRAKLMQEYFG